MVRDCNAFKERFEAYKNGKSVNEIYSFLPKYEDGKRYIPDDEGGWDRITDDELTDVFANLVVTPNKNRQEKVVNRPGEYDLRLRRRINNAPYISNDIIEDDSRVRYQLWLREHKGEQGLLIVSPEFDILMLSSGLRSNPLTQRLWNERTLAKEMNKTFDKGLTGATKDMPLIYDVGQVINPEHVIRQGKISPKASIGVKNNAPVEETIVPETAIRKEAKLKTPYIRDDLQPSDLYQGLYERTPEIFEKTKVDLLSGLPVVEPVQELIYNGNLAKRIVPRQELGLYTLNILNPNIFTEQPKGLSGGGIVYDETFVDRNGNVNMRNLVKAIQEAKKDFPQMRNYKDIYNYDTKRNKTNLYQHIRDVVKTALSIPVPEGYTRLDLVQAALFHDVGKVLEGLLPHELIAPLLIDIYASNTPEHVKNAVRHHMSNHMLDKDNLTRALHFADVARGLDYDQAAYTFPLLLYDFLKPILNIPKIHYRDELKTRINPWLKSRGYKTINLNLSEEEAWKELEERVLHHKTLERGVRDPLKPYEASPDNDRNAENAIQILMKEFGVSREEAASEAMTPLRLKIAGERISLTPTGSGRSHLFGTYKTDSHGRTIHTDDSYSKMIGANPKTQDAIYASTSDEVKNTYASQRVDRTAGGFILNMPVSKRRVGESMSEFLLRNDWDLYSLDKIMSMRPPTGTGNMYEGPYRLLTGRSLQSDIRKEGIVKPVYIENPDVLLKPGNTIMYNGFRTTYDTVNNSIGLINNNLKTLGISFELKSNKDGNIYMPKKLMDLSYDINLLANIKRDLTPIRGFDIRKYDNITQRIMDDVLLKTLDDRIVDDFGFGINSTNDLYKLPKEQRDALINEVDALLDPEYIKYILGEDVVSDETKKYYSFSFPSGRINEMKLRGFITDKQLKAMRLAYYHNGDPLKYVNVRKIADDLVTKYLQSVKKNAHKKMKVDPKSMRITPHQMLDFLRSHSVIPRYELEGFGENVFFAQTAPSKNKTINEPFTKELVGYILGRKGEKKLEIREDAGYELVNKKTRGRDHGMRTNNKMTRKTLRTIGAITTVGSTTLKPRRKKE